MVPERRADESLAIYTHKEQRGAAVLFVRTYTKGKELGACVEAYFWATATAEVRGFGFYLNGYPVEGEVKNAIEHARRWIDRQAFIAEPSKDAFCPIRWGHASAEKYPDLIPALESLELFAVGMCGEISRRTKDRLESELASEIWIRDLCRKVAKQSAWAAATELLPRGD